jgi:uncharacterized protein (TIGR00730 family)
MNRICVFCGSSPGARPDYVAAARELGRELAGRRIGLVYGGASVGVMGELARAVRAQGGDVIGAIPSALARAEVALTDLEDLRVVNTMHERKALMTELSDGFIAMPGGLGTMEEYLEVLTWAQLGLHRKPCGLLNTCGYFGPLITFFESMIEEQFAQPAVRSFLLVDSSPRSLLDRFESYRAPHVDKAKWALRLRCD